MYFCELYIVILCLLLIIIGKFSSDIFLKSANLQMKNLVINLGE